MVDEGDERSQQLRAALARDRYPRASRYDPADQLEALAGAHVLWSLEALCEAMHLEPGMRVLDLGCGFGLGSVFLAKEYGVQVVALDSSISPSETWRRATVSGLDDAIHPVSGDARKLPFPTSYFDAIVAISAFQYFGTEDLYLRHVTRFLRRGGRLGIVLPGLVHDLDPAPDDLPPLWRIQYETFHTCAWWRHFWGRTGLVEVEVADLISDAIADWAHWYRVAAEFATKPPGNLVGESAFLSDDGGERFGLVRVVGRKP